MVKRRDVIEAFAARHNVPVSRVRCVAKAVVCGNSGGLSTYGIPYVFYDKSQTGEKLLCSISSSSKEEFFITNVFKNLPTQVEFGYGSFSHVADYTNIFTKRIYLFQRVAVSGDLSVYVCVNYYHLFVMPDLS